MSYSQKAPASFYHFLVFLFLFIPYGQAGGGDSSCSFKAAVSITTASLFLPLQFSGFDGCAGTALPRSRYWLRQLYRVTAGTPTSRLTCATDCALGGIKRLTAYSLNSSLYRGTWVSQTASHWVSC